MKITTTAPTRISLFGGGTDLPVFYEKHEGLCISMAINLPMQFDINVSEWDMDSPDFGEQSFYDTFFKEYKTKYEKFRGFSATPIRSGLGSSASSAVALVSALERMMGNNPTRAEIAEKAWEIEVNKLKLYGGKQDQYAAAFGGMNVLEFKKDVTVTPISRESAENIAQSVLLFHTGIERTDKKIQENLKKLDRSKEGRLTTVKDIAHQALGYVERGDVKTVGQLLHIAWEAKKRTNSVTNPEIDNIYDIAMSSGAIGGKLLGSGGGGFMAFVVQKNNQQHVIDTLEKVKGVKWYDFGIDWSGVNTRIL